MATLDQLTDIQKQMNASLEKLKEKAKGLKSIEGIDIGEVQKMIDMASNQVAALNKIVPKG